MKTFCKSAIIIGLGTLMNFSKIFAQVGIGTTTPDPSAMLHVDLGSSNTKGLLVTGTLDINLTGTVPSLGAGSRLMFYPGRAAFRTGYVTGSNWDNQNVGFYSTAMGQNTIANNSVSTAMGYGTTASGFYSTSMGYNTIASGESSTAMGRSTTASGESSTAIGYNATASGYASIAMGAYTTASADYSTTMGSKVSTNGFSGSFAIGDSDPNNEGTTLIGASDRFVARFWNGYYLLTSGNTGYIGVYIPHNGNAWLSICDKNRKENFAPLDGEDILQKIANIKFTSWNYKMQDPKIYRHYGIMAQDFYNAFGHDKYGTIGNDTTVNPIDMIGINMTAIQALEKRTENLKNENENLRTQNAKLENDMEALNERLKRLEASNPKHKHKTRLNSGSDVTPSGNENVYVYDSSQVNALMDYALNIEEIGKPTVVQDSFSTLTTTYFKVTVALDENNHLIKNPGDQQNQSNQSTARKGSNGTAVVSIGCEYSCQRHTDDEGCATGGCFSNGKGRCSVATCGTCKTTLKCRPIKSGFGLGGSQIIF